MMAQIIVFQGDPELLNGIDVDLTACSVADYVRVYDQIARALHRDEAYRVAVSDGTVAAWLGRMQDRYGKKRIEIRKLTLRGRLSEQLQLDIPDWVTDDQIRQAKLLDVNISADPGRDFEDFILEVFFSPFLARKNIPLTQLDDLVSSYDPDQWDQNKKITLLNTVLSRRLNLWENRARHEGEKILVQWLKRDPAYLGKQLAILKATEGYGRQIGQRTLGSEFPLLSDLELDLSQVEVNETTVSDALDQVRVHLHHLTESLQPGEALDVILGQACGQLEIEFDVLQVLLRSGDLTIDAEIVDRIRKLFTPIRNRPHIDQALADLDLLIKPKDPPLPNSDWGEEEWLNWAVHSYLPYRFWLEEIGQLRGDVADLAELYADWLYGYYKSTRLHSERMIYQALPKLRPMIQDSSVTLILVLDNFNQKFWRDFQRYMQHAGFFNQETAYYLSMLPSATEISKKCLITGQPGPFEGTAYEGPVKQVWESALKGRKVCYLPHIGALRRVKQQEHDVYFLNYLPIDIAFHQDEQHTGISHAQAARSHLRALAEDIRAFGERIGAERDLVVISLSDHGSTRIPANEPNPIDPSFFKKKVEDKHHRYVSIKDDELDNLPENVQYQCYIFERGRYDLQINYLAAKRHYRFKPTTENIYVHGGLTPEETIVPVAIFKPVRVTPKPIQVSLLDRGFYYGRRSQLRFELVNTNAYVCEAVTIEILNVAVDMPAVEVGDLGIMSQREVATEGRFRRGREDLISLDVRVSYEFLGEPQQQTSEIEITMKKMMEQKFDLGEFLD